MIFVFFLLIYYWYLFFHRFIPVEKPTTPSKPTNLPSYELKFSSKQPNHFQFVLNGKQVWEHTLPPNTFIFHRNKIVDIDPCHGIEDGRSIPATGKSLYDHLMKSLTVANKFKENSQRTLQNGTVFFFECSKGRVDQLKMCPSGTMLSENACEIIGVCTHETDGTLFSHRDPKRYIRCQNGREIVENCPENHIFYHNRCELIDELSHKCKMNPNKSFKFSDKARIDCRNGKTVFVKCKNDFMFFDKEYCESPICNGKTDGEKISLLERQDNVFQYNPGYITCLKDRIHETVECPQNWSESEIPDHNLSFLPMVFDGDKCSIPQFCTNVFSKNINTIVPVYEFTKDVKNWKFSKLLDHSEGYVCENGSRKRKILVGDARISKHFKEEPACENLTVFKKLFIKHDESSYYDCDLKQSVSCPQKHFFNGSNCVPKPENAFEYKNFPLFQFDSLNAESWIKAYDYEQTKEERVRCEDPYQFNVHNICVHPACSRYMFVSQIPDLAVLLPSEEKAKCKFYKDEKILKKEPVDFDYDYWSQGSPTTKPCEPGQHLRTGNFIWDSTVFATCEKNQPFIFCPSTLSKGIILVQNQFWTCKPPERTLFTFEAKEWTTFETNEIKRVFPATKQLTRIRRNKGSDWEDVPEKGLYIPENTKFVLLSSGPVQLEVRYRVSHPPNVAFRYNDDGSITHLTHADQVYLIKQKNFTARNTHLPQYKPVVHVDYFEKELYI